MCVVCVCVLGGGGGGWLHDGDSRQSSFGAGCRGLLLLMSPAVALAVVAATRLYTGNNMHF